jgi:hypothetical protein
MKHQPLRLNLLSMALVASLGSVAHAAVDPSLTGMAQTFVGIQIPAQWTIASGANLGTVTLTATATSDGTSKRIDGSIGLADYVILVDTAIATELELQFARAGVVYAKCIFDTAGTLGAATLNLANYQLRAVQRPTGEIQFQMGSCKVANNGVDFVVGIPELQEGDDIQLNTANLILQSTLPPQS